MTYAAPYIHVPVDEIEIVNGPSRDEITPYEWVDCLSAGSLLFTLRTTASKKTFRRRIKVYDVQIGTLEDYVMRLEDENHEDEATLFDCVVGGCTFFGSYNLATRAGKLTYVYRAGYES